MTMIPPSSILAAVLVGCGPSVDDEPEPVGTLEFSYGFHEGWGHDGYGTGEWYRLGRRVEFIPEQNPYDEWKCGMLTERAYDDIERTIAALDPDVDYDFEAGHEECLWSHSPSAYVHVEGHPYSPFSCDFFCCRDELFMVGLVYFLAHGELAGETWEFDGEPYVATEADEPCE